MDFKNFSISLFGLLLVSALQLDVANARYVSWSPSAADEVDITMLKSQDGSNNFNREYLSLKLNSPKYNVTCSDTLGYVNWDNAEKYAWAMGFAGKFEIDVFRKDCANSREMGTIDDGKRISGGFGLKFLSAGLEGMVGEAGLGLMVRWSIFDIYSYTDSIRYIVGAGLDTGILVARKKIELKLLGIGGKLEKSGAQACFVICVGFKWNGMS